MRKAGGLAGVGEGEREGTIFPQNSTDQRFKTALSSRKIQQISVLRQHSVGSSNKIKDCSVFKTVFCR